jgi:hypothetical protein
MNGHGKAQLLDCELWRMPIDLAHDVRGILDRKTKTRHNRALEKLKGQMEDVAGRSKGAVSGFIGENPPSAAEG